MPEEKIEHHEPPEFAVECLRLAGGKNRFDEPNFRVVWGYNRIVKMTGPWGLEGAIETREVPKYLPGNRWHLEMWRPPEEYGSPETWGKLGQEVVGMMTVDTAGPFPHRGEYELCYTLSSDLTVQGDFVPLNARVVELLVLLIKKSGEQKMSLATREAAIKQRLERERKQRIEEGADILLNERPAFYDQPTSFASGPKTQKIKSGLYVPPSYRQ